MGPAACFPAFMEDLAKTIEFAKENSIKYNIDTDNLYPCTSLAGRHLCAYFGARYKDFEKGFNYSLRPTGIILAYPIITMLKDTHEISKLTLIGAERRIIKRQIS